MKRKWRSGEKRGGGRERSKVTTQRIKQAYMVLKEKASEKFRAAQQTLSHDIFTYNITAKAQKLSCLKKGCRAGPS